MPTTPTRLRNWATLVRRGEADPYTVANMLDHCAKRFEEYEARIEVLEDDVAALLRDLHMLVDGDSS